MTPPAVPRLDWDALLALGLGPLGFNAEDFWSLSPREFRAALRLHLSAAPTAAFTRTDLNALAHAFPDTPNPEPPP